MLEKIDLAKLKKEDITQTVKAFSEELGNRKGFKTNQLRKYYNNLMALKSKHVNGSDFDSLALDLGIFASKVEYGVIKADRRDEEGFKFYKENIIVGLSDKIDSFEKFRNFMTVMEAVVAYFPKTN